MRDLNEIKRADDAAIAVWAANKTRQERVTAAAHRVVNAVMREEQEKAIRDLRAALYGANEPVPVPPQHC
jgi:hypothetical protein